MSRATDVPEQDVGGGDDLPTYENLAQTHGPNSRFGRWRSWIEKRAAERYVDVTPEEWQRRRQRGWGDGLADHAIPEDRSSTPTPSSSLPTLQLYTDFKDLPKPPDQPAVDEPLEYDPSLPIVGESLRPAHLGLHQLGSRFLPHTTSPIRALLPLLGDRLLLIGHDNGLSVLNMFPQEWTDVGLQTRGPGEAQAHSIWTGEGVFQMSLLEVEEIGESTPQGVVLFLIGSDPESAKEQESTRVLRMYNLASLISLAKWTISQKAFWPPGKGPEITRDRIPPEPEPPSPYRANRQDSSGSMSRKTETNLSPPDRTSSFEPGWDFVDELPLRWATDYVPLAVPGSRLMNASVLTYALWRNDDQPRGSALLAVAIKSAILLYESPKRERAFRFVKEFYTPLSPRGITFVYQSVQDNLSRSASDGTYTSRTASQHNHLRGSRCSMHQRPASLTTTVLNPQLSLFIVFEKKVGLIRLVNSAVGEVALFDDSGSAHFSSSRDSLAPSPSGLATLSGRRSRTSLDGFGLAKDNRASWTLPAKFDLPTAAAGIGSPTDSLSSGPSSPQDDDDNNDGYAAQQSVYLLTRGKQSFVLPCPLPANLQATAPLLTISWRSHPTYVSPRVIKIDRGDGGGSPGGSEGGGSSLGSGGAGGQQEGSSQAPPPPPPLSTPPGRGRGRGRRSSSSSRSSRYRHVLQLTAFGEDGLEIQEAPLSPLSFSGREKARAEEPVVAEVVLGETGFLSVGGHWHRPYDAPLDLARSYSMRSTASFDSMATEEVISRLESDQGIYGWQRKGLEDWRIFWIGGVGEKQRTGGGEDDD
ncbi:hypothetical protein BJV78DRAFT_1284612 [Lactifluus subvellereus]|nr:hypothetical protein BJV78DRAFT_1284612 [Lactifluus subvellereus]